MKFLLITLLLVLSPPVFSAFAADSDITWLGIVRADQKILPFALFDGSRWSNPWPGYNQVDPDDPSTPGTLEEIPKDWYEPLSDMPREWNIQYTYSESTTVKVTRPVIFHSWCTTFMGLLIGDGPHGQEPREGFAASSSIQTQPLTAIDKGSAEYERMLSFIRQAFEQAEEEYQHPLLTIARAEAGFSVECLVRSQPGPDDSTIAYFEVEREYGGKYLQNPSESEFFLSYMSGWILMDSTGTLSFIEKRFANKWPTDFAGLNRFTPLGTAVVDGKSIWIIRQNAEEGVSYWVVHVTQSGIKILFRFHGGGC